MKRVIILLSSLVALGCSSAVEQKDISIKGKWKTSDKPTESYITLDFADSTAVFDTLGDTILRFKYSIDQSSRTLQLTDIFNRKSSAKILKASSDSLVFNHLWDINTMQTFTKK